MKFRFYQLFYVATAVLVVLTLLKPLMYFVEPDGSQITVGNFCMTAEDGSSSSAIMALGIVLVFVGLLNVFALLVSLFSNFELLKRCTILSMLLLAGYYILFLIYSLIYSGEAAADMELPMLFPFIGLTLNVFAFLLIRRHEAKIVAQALGFRLRD